MQRFSLFFLLIIPACSFAATKSPDLPSLSPALSAFLALSILSIAPSLIVMLSSFTRIVIVLSLLRTALGLQQTPPNSVLMSLALFLTCFTMMPVIKSIYWQAYVPYQENRLSEKQALQKTLKPLEKFMLHQTREKELLTILQLAKEDIPEKASEVKFYQLIPAFLLSEMQTAFQIGFILFLPFLLIDLVVSAILMIMGMMMMPPTTISLPIKILVFVLIDGWDLVVQSLVSSFN